MSGEPIFVTRPDLPPLADLVPLLEDIWDSRILTNKGPFHERFEAELQKVLGVPHVLLMSNGMLALEAAIDAAGLSGEIITTPYSFVATTHAVRRARLTPVFADVRPHDLNIDPAAVEAAITENSSAIVAVHCYGSPCDVEALDDIARRHGLKLIYDAAHAFGVTYRGAGLLSHGDYATLSFHATKTFNTFEGGAVVTRSAEDRQSVEFQRNFGIADETTVPAVGGNAKMSEFNAALGLLQLARFERARALRAAIDSRYRDAFAGLPGLEPLPLPAETVPNYSYFPVLVTEDYPLDRDALYDALKERGIYSRRYFYPLLSSLPMYRDNPSAAPANLPVANRAAEQILCLPIYPDLAEDDQQRVIGMVRALGGSR